MSVHDEFYSLPPEDAPLPKDAVIRRGEENPYISKDPDTVTRENEERKAKNKRNSLKKMLTGALAGVTVITSVAGNDIFYRTHDNRPISRYELYTRMDAGLVDDDEKSAYLTDGYAAHSLGVLVSKEPIDLSEPIKLEFDVFLTGYGEFADGHGADGISIGFSTYENVRGLDGGLLGYDSEFGIELDLCENPAEETDGGMDYPDDHISILGNSVWNALAVSSPMNIDDGKWHRITIEYKNSILSVKYDRRKILQAEIENDYQKLYLKIGGSTGNGLCYQKVSNIRINSEVLLIDDDYGVEKIDYSIITDFSGDRLETESLILDKETIDTTTENTPASGQNTAGSFSGQSSSTDRDLTDEDNDASGNSRTDNTDSSEVTGHTEASENTGLPEKECSACNGTGIICPGSLAADDPEGCHGTVIVNCKACGGTGREANGKPCNWCKGTLKHMCPSFESHYTCPDCDGTGQTAE